VALKLITQIRRWIEKEAPDELQVQEYKELANGFYYDFYRKNYRFCLVLQDLKSGPKVNWIFHKDLTDDEKAYWEGRYEFKVNGQDKITKSHLQIGDIHNHDEVKVLMTRTIPTLRVFRKDLRWILVMAKQEGKA
jgi:hypothetical protein